MSIETRIHKAVSLIELMHFTAVDFTAHVALDVYRQLKHEVNPDLAHIHEVTHVSDVPVKIDLNLKPGEIVLRYEVAA